MELLQFFAYAHQPSHLVFTARNFCAVAHKLARLPADDALHADKAAISSACVALYNLDGKLRTELRDNIERSAALAGITYAIHLVANEFDPVGAIRTLLLAQEDAFRSFSLVDGWCVVDESGRAIRALGEQDYRSMLEARVDETF